MSEMTENVIQLSIANILQNSNLPGYTFNPSPLITTEVATQAPCSNVLFENNNEIKIQADFVIGYTDGVLNSELSFTLHLEPNAATDNNFKSVVEIGAGKSRQP